MSTCSTDRQNTMFFIVVLSADNHQRERKGTHRPRLYEVQMYEKRSKKRESEREANLPQRDNVNRSIALFI
jgi:hypothetical protein